MARADIGALLSRVVEWAQGAGVEVALLVGSWARRDQREESDVDLVLLTADPHIFLEDTRWATNFGTVARLVFEDWGRLQSVRAWYAEGWEVEFGFSDLAWGTDGDPGSRSVLRRGFRPLLDTRGRFCGWPDSLDYDERTQ